VTGHLIEFTTITTEAGDELSHRAACLCGQTSESSPHYWQVEDWAAAHRATVARARAALGRTPSLRNTATHYRRMANDPSRTNRERAEWALLADEIEARILRHQPLSDDDQLHLF
jgi:hypothetical protein